MKEEKVTISLLKWLESDNWEIICFDFPQSGTGMLLQANSTSKRKTKNKGAIIPDIIAVKSGLALFFENKDRYVESDFTKIRDIKLSNDYSESLGELIDPIDVRLINYGIGIPHVASEINKGINNLQDIDFLLSVSDDGTIRVIEDKNGVF